MGDTLNINNDRINKSPLQLHLHHKEIKQAKLRWKLLNVYFVNLNQTYKYIPVARLFPAVDLFLVVQPSHLLKQ